jgi:hypothetical protein
MEKHYIEIGVGESDEFIISDKEVGYDEFDNVYTVYISVNTHTLYNCLGKIRAIVGDDGEVLCLVYPLMSPKRPYYLITTKILEKHSKLYAKVKK